LLASFEPRRSENPNGGRFVRKPTNHRRQGIIETAAQVLSRYERTRNACTRSSIRASCSGGHRRRRRVWRHSVAVLHVMRNGYPPISVSGGGKRCGHLHLPEPWSTGQARQRSTHLNQNRRRLGVLVTARLWCAGEWSGRLVSAAAVW